MGKVVVSIPSILASLFKGERELRVSANSLRELIEKLVEMYGIEVRERFLDAKDALKPTINIYVNGRNVRFSGGLDTPLQDQDTVSILPAVAGG